MDIEYLGDSTCVASAGFESGYLTVNFQDGTTFTYQGVDPYTWRSFKMSVSKGYFFNTQIRNNYSFFSGNAPELSVNTKLLDKALQGIEDAEPGITTDLLI
jgi:hypothetical protein